MDNADKLVVRRQWNDFRQAEVLLSNLHDAHWSNISGGCQAPAPQPFIHGYIWCSDIIAGEIAHSCMHGEGPHRIKVCVVKKDNSKAIYNKLLNEVGPKPSWK